MADKGSKNNIIQQEVKRLMEEQGANEYLSENVIHRLRAKYKDHDIIDQVQESYMDVTREQKKKAKKFAKLVLNKYGVQYPLHILLKKALRYKQKYNLSDVEFSLFQKTYEKYMLGQTNDERVKKFYTPYTTMTKVLGRSDRSGDQMNVSSDEYKYLDKILRLEAESKAMHAQVSLQSMTYKGFDIAAMTGRFNNTTGIDNPSCFVHPILAAMFIPKFELFDNHMLLASIPRIIKTRKSNNPLITSNDYELFYDIVSDPTDMACSTTSPLLDLQLRSELQYSIWQSVLMLRYGKYYDCASNMFLASTENCKLNKYDDAPDFLHVGDEGSIIRRLLSAFSMRPTIVETSRQHNLEFQYPLRPDNNALNIRVESTPMLSLRLGSTPQDMAGQNIRDVNYVLNSTQYFYDRELKVVLPRQVKVLYSKSVLIINIPRRMMKLDYTNLVRPAQEWSKLPRNYVGIDRINDTPINVANNIELDGGLNYQLQSAIKLNVNSEITNNQYELIVGLSAILNNYTNIGGQAVDNFFLYNPSSVTQLNQPASSINLATLGRNSVSGAIDDPNVRFNTPIQKLDSAKIGSNSVENAEQLLEQYSTILFYKNISDGDAHAAMNSGNVGNYFYAQ